MRKIMALVLITAFSFTINSCVTLDNQRYGKKFFPDNIVWKEFSTDTLVWLKGGIGSLKPIDLIKKFGEPTTLVQASDFTLYGWEYRETSKKQIDYLVGQSQKSFDVSYSLNGQFSNSNDGKLIDFYLSKTSSPGKVQIWTSEKVVELGILAGTFYIGGRFIKKTIDKATSAGQSAAEGLTP